MEPLLGQIVLLPYNFAPRGLMFCDGQLLPISEYTALYSLIGTTFGGDGKTTFALPNYPAPTGSHYCIAVMGMFPQR